MKYEISQRQYRDFLNTLTSTQRGSRTATMTSTKYVMTDTDTVSFRNGLYTADGSTVVCDLDDDATGNETNDGQWIACDCLCWYDLTAYADWAALRPMSELEFEKACRGPISPVNLEYAWGTTDITEATSHTNSGYANEGVGQSGKGLCAYYNAGGLSGPCRTGFAATSTTNRVQSGATYYGIMEMSGNVAERAVTVGHSDGRGFEGTHGDGALTSNGDANCEDWTGYDGGPVTGFRGGAWDMAFGPDVLPVSNRSFASDDIMLERYESYGGRCVRTAP
jgi:formylglycine-generating enzyme required for sulfatase activity